MPDYSKGKIYKLCSSSCDEVYIGSTTQKLCQRLREHQKDFENWCETNEKFLSSYEILSYNNASIQLLEKYSCSSSKELNRREGEWIRMTDKCVNRYIAGRTHKEYVQDNFDRVQMRKAEWTRNNAERCRQVKSEYYVQNKDTLNKKKREYYEANKEVILKKQNQYTKEHKEQIRIRQKKWVENNQEHCKEYRKKYREKNSEYLKEWKANHYEENKEKIRVKGKEYRKKNAEQISQRRKENNIMCECGSLVRKNNYSEHKKMNKHLDWMISNGKITEEEGNRIKAEVKAKRDAKRK